MLHAHETPAQQEGLSLRLRDGDIGSFPRLLPGLKEPLWKVLSTGPAHSVAAFLASFLYFWLHCEACRILVPR